MTKYTLILLLGGCQPVNNTPALALIAVLATVYVVVRIVQKVK